MKKRKKKKTKRPRRSEWKLCVRLPVSLFVISYSACVLCCFCVTANKVFVSMDNMDIRSPIRHALAALNFFFFFDTVVFHFSALFLPT